MLSLHEFAPPTPYINLFICPNPTNCLGFLQLIEFSTQSIPSIKPAIIIIFGVKYDLLGAQLWP